MERGELRQTPAAVTCPAPDGERGAATRQDGEWGGAARWDSKEGGPARRDGEGGGAAQSRDGEGGGVRKFSRFRKLCSNGSKVF